MAFTLISVVAPCLNEAKYLPTFLSSLTKQTLQPQEVIIVDGGSTDRSLQIIKNYKLQLNLNVVYCPHRNFGIIRNLGHWEARSHIVFQCNTDNYFPSNLLEKIAVSFLDDPELIALTGRVVPMGTSLTAKVAYPAFDLLRWFFSRWKFRPSGSFIVYRNWVWYAVNGFPEVTVNEDGRFGQRIDGLAYPKRFDLKLWVGHYVKKFESMGGPKALLFYLYVLSNHFPMLSQVLKPIENKAGRVFSGLQSF